jgi:fused signal recognition particle receptor
MDMMTLILMLVGAVLLVAALVFVTKRKPKEKVISIDSASAEAIKLESPAVSQTPPIDDFAKSRTLKQALEKTEESIWGRLKSALSGEISKKYLDEIEEVLYTSDLGPKTVQRLLAIVDEALSRSEKQNIDQIKIVLKDEFLKIFTSAKMQEPGPDIFSHFNLSTQPTVWLVVGVNGVGKTTTIGKLAAHLAKQGKKVLVAAGDTFRAAAEAQLKVWTERAQVEIFSPAGVTDPSAVAFDAIQKGKAQNYDVIIIDTAGRLHTQANLMEELKKLKRVMAKVIPEAPHETLIVLDANSGQNAFVQAREFHNALGLTGVVLTKMDGTAKGGVAVGLANELQIPIRLIGVGEKIGDLQAFSAKEFTESILD